MSAKKIVLAYMTAPSAGKALKLGHLIVDAKLAACANVLPKMTSIYQWKGKVSQANESVLILKTTAARVPKLKAFVKKIHPYANPCLLILPVSNGLADFLKWIASPQASDL